MRTLIAVDPGKNGAIARMIIPHQGETHIETWDMPETERDLADLFENISKGIDVRGLIEKVGGMPGQGGWSMFVFGRGYGAVRMAMICNKLSFDEVTPQAWQKALGIATRKKTETKVMHKNKLKQKAQQLFPKMKITLANADAILMLEYLRRISHSPTSV